MDIPTKRLLWAQLDALPVAPNEQLARSAAVADRKMHRFMHKQRQWIGYDPVLDQLFVLEGMNPPDMSEGMVGISNHAKAMHKRPWNKRG